MKKNFFYLVLLIISLTCLSICIFTNITYSEFNSTLVKKNISNFSSLTYSGRLPGSDENSLIGEIIRKNFQDNGLSPLNDNYKEYFSVICPVKTNTKPYLQVSVGDIVIEELNYGIDFKEDMLNFKNNTLTFSKEDKINIYTDSIEVITDKGNCLFIVPKNNDFSFRSSFVSDLPYDMVVMITTATYNKILNYSRDGLEISIHLPFTTEEKKISNVVGVINGYSNKLPPLVLTAHFDHLGKDGLENTYVGALDNASGTSFLLELQRTLSSYGKPNRNIIFVALNAEEFGLLGSKNFAEGNIDILKGAEVINFDMIGSANYPITFMQGMSFKDKNSSLLNSVVDISKDLKAPFEVIYQDSSDHASFNNIGIDSISFCHSDMSKIHTPNDKVEFISTDAIDSVYKIVNEKVKDSCYGYITQFVYSGFSIFVFSLISGALIVIIFLNRKKIK